MKRISRRLLMVAGVCLGVSAIIFLGLLLFGYEKVWLLPTTLSCVSLSLLFQAIFQI